MSEKDVQRWAESTQLADAEGTGQKRAGIRQFLEEAEGAASYALHYWDPADGRPGLSQAAGVMGEEIVEELQSLIRAARTIESSLRVRDEQPARKALLAEARSVNRELDSACGFIIMAQGSARLRSALRGLRQRLGAGSIPRLAIALTDLATMAEELQDDLVTIGVDLATISRARALSQELSTLSDPRLQRRPRRQLRDRLLALADQRISTICAAARFVFRDHPEALAAGRRRAFRGS